MTAKELIFRERLVIIARGIEADLLAEAAQALSEAGVCLLESTFDHRLPDPLGDNAEKLLRVKLRLGDKMRLGAGTVLSVREVQSAFDAGCEYIISPGTNEDVIRETKRLGMLAIPGALTPTEICRAWDLGADLVKLFPADDLGMHYLQNLRGPLPHIPLMATGGVNPDTIPEFLKRGVCAVGTGVTVLRYDLLAARDFDGMARLARLHVEAVRRAQP